jgi:DnaJ family protein C protein 7
MYTQALLRDPRNATALEERRLAELTAARVARARDALAAGDARRAAALLAPAAEAAPASADVALLRAEAALATGDLDAAQSVTATVLARFGPSTRVLVLRARVLHRQGNTASAIRHLQEGLRHDPDSAELAAALRPLKRLETRREEGNAAFAAGRWVDAERAYSDALAADATSAAGTAKLLANRAAARLKLRQWAAAVDDCTACLELDASFVKALMRRATALRELGGAENLERAMRDLEAAKRSVDDGDSLRSLEADLRQVKRDLKAAKRKDYYAILGVARDADEDAVRKAYRKAALQWHPDRHSSEPEEQRKRAEAMFKDVGEAYTVLSDADKRRRYDLGGGEDGFDDDDDGHGHGHGGMRMSEMDLFNMLFSGMHSAPGRGRGGGGGGGGGFHFSF